MKKIIKIKSFMFALFGILGVLLFANTSNAAIENNRVMAYNNGIVSNIINGGSAFEYSGKVATISSGKTQMYLYDDTAIKYNVSYNGNNYSLLKNGVYSYHNSSTGMDNYVAVYQCTDKIVFDRFSLGSSEGSKNTSFSATFTVDDSTTLSECLTFTESVEVEAFGNSISAGIKQSLAASGISGTTSSMSFDFSYDKIAAGSNVSHSAQITEYAYDYIVKVYVSRKNGLSPEVTYNFEVEDFHTYYVGENSILVHNKCSVNNTKTQELSKEIDPSKKTNFKCKDFAEDLKSKMNKNGIHGEKIEIKPNYGTDYIYSDSLKGSISTNGYHCGIQVDGIVYDNLHPNGIPFIEWINDLGGEGLFNIIRSIF